MIKKFLLTALAVATVGAAIPADAQRDERRGRGDRSEQHEDRGAGRYGRPRHGQFGQHHGYNNGGRYPDRRWRGRYYNNGHYYHHRYRNHGGWSYR